MPWGNPNRQTISTEKYQKKAGYRAKTFKIKGDIGDRFAVACRLAGVSQSSKITELMQEFIDQVYPGKSPGFAHEMMQTCENHDL